MSDTVEWMVEPLVSVVGVHTVIHADRGNRCFDEDTTRLDVRIGSVNDFDLARFRHGQHFVGFGRIHQALAPASEEVACPRGVICLPWGPPWSHHLGRRVSFRHLDQTRPFRSPEK